MSFGRFLLIIETILAIKEKKKGTTTKDYLYHFSGKFPKLNYVMEDENREAVYEAIMEEVNLLKAVPYRFIDRRTGKERTMQIGHTVQTGSGDEHVQVNLSSYFKIDGVKCWDYLAELGYSFEIMARGIRPIFDVYHYGVKVAHVETGGTNDVREKDNPIGKLPVNGIFRVTCRGSDMEAPFIDIRSHSKTLPGIVTAREAFSDYLVFSSPLAEAVR